ncbi:SGNH/GDSL hydrolase family protein [Cyanobacterium stanieri LEGE 03274]|uniref:SGNH/GDSL hydrolase family protein n=1 Tax=Cyanobacterium stanieri LEGE 03274 TaxID=1828756 RepID=A0ABR9UZQ4_9CHRO|nr:SGNH/GDSL hydrolase family protein [Cyanobacterium stanieri]MBE9221128.1 SGNH/GDSL hydrolase family protein [Cyanobacterium stanieri LEGE 03274]
MNFIFFLVIFIVLLEIFLRIKWGFGNPLIYIKDPEIGYLIAPNQVTRRNGNLIKINSYSMRYDEIKKQKEKNTFRIILLGDSIVNGGWWTDQKETLSSLLEQKIINNQSSLNQVEVLNISANSWGARNELAYLQKYGSFSGNILILVLNTDDLFSFAPSSIQVGKALNYPDKKPLLALEEFFKKVLPLPIHPDLRNIPKETGDVVAMNLKAVKDIYEIAKKDKMDFFLALTPLKREVFAPFSKDYEIKARERLNYLVNELEITYTDFLPLFKSYSNPDDLYHDHIHLSHEGNKLLVNHWQKNITLH